MGVRFSFWGLRHFASTSQKPQEEEPGEGRQAAALCRACTACTASIGIPRGVAATLRTTLVGAAVEATVTITTVGAPVIPGVTATVIAALGHT